MDTLPLELKQRVYSYLTTKDLKSLRLTAKVYASAACHNFIPRIFLHNHPNSFQEIQDIANHPDLKQSVTTLVVDTSWLRLYPRYDEWIHLFVPTPEYKAEIQRLEVSTDSLDPRAKRRLRREKVCEKWKVYQDRAYDQRKTSSKNRIIDSIALAFQQCPRLKNLIVEFGGRHLNSVQMYKKASRIYKNDFPSPTTHSATLLWLWDNMTFAIWDLLNPIHDANRALESLVLLGSHLLCPQDRTFPATSIFKGLKHLRESGSPANFLTSVVASAPGLESFGTLAAYGRYVDSSLSSLTSGPPLTKLRACSLGPVNNGDLLVHFLLRQSDTLQRLRIRNGQYLTHIHWKSVAMRVKGKLRNL